jgi:hypothetical protein
MYACKVWYKEMSKVILQSGIRVVIWNQRIWKWCWCKQRFPLWCTSLLFRVEYGIVLGETGPQYWIDELVVPWGPGRFNPKHTFLLVIIYRYSYAVLECNRLVQPWPDARGIWEGHIWTQCWWAEWHCGHWQWGPHHYANWMMVRRKFMALSFCLHEEVQSLFH